MTDLVALDEERGPVEPPLARCVREVSEGWYRASEDVDRDAPAEGLLRCRPHEIGGQKLTDRQ